MTLEGKDKMCFEFLIEGETIDGDLICETWGYPRIYETWGYNIKIENQTDALKRAEEDAIALLGILGGGHVDIFNLDYKFLNDVEV